MSDKAPFSHVCQLEQMHSDDLRIGQIMGQASNPDIKNISRARLLRISNGLHHLLTEVIPQIEDIPLRQEVYLWVSRCYQITQFEQIDQEKGR